MAAVLRIGAACGIAGAILLIAANAAHPRPSRSEVGDHEAFLRLAADSGSWLVVHLGILLGALLLLGGLVGVSYSLRGDRAEWLSRLALVGALVGTTVGIVQHGVDMAYGEVADDWAAGAGEDKATLLHIGSALEHVDFTLFSVNVVVFFGVTFVLYGLALVASSSYPRPLGWVATLAGLAAAVVGVVQLFMGPSDATLYVFPVIAAVVSLWVLAASVLVWRRARVA
jgi:hypothetical protein